MPKIAVAQNQASPSGDPICVDLDGTLIRTDLLWEACVSALFRSPVGLLRALLAFLLGGKARFKQRMAALWTPDAHRLPYRRELVAYLHERKALGQQVHLVSASPQSWVAAIADHCRIFDTAVGSTDRLNLRAAHKSGYLMRQFPSGFVYAGDSRADLPVWRQAKAAILVGRGVKYARRIDAEDGIQASFGSDNAVLRPIIKSLRIHQWAKNVLILVPAALAGEVGNWGLMSLLLAAFLAFSMVCSGTYLLNDLVDLDHDRRHPIKRRRPIASGQLAISIALLGAAVLIGVGLVASFLIHAAFGVAVVAYLAVTFSYSLRLKQIPFVDLFALALLYTLRLAMGSIVAGHGVSTWLLVFSMALFFALSAVKRSGEMAALADNEPAVSGRGYLPGDQPLLLNFGVATSVAALVIFVLYLENEAFVRGIYVEPRWLWLAPACLLLWLCRLWFLAHRGRMSADPVMFALTDKWSWALALIVGGALLLSHLPQ